METWQHQAEPHQIHDVEDAELEVRSSGRDEERGKIEADEPTVGQLLREVLAGPLRFTGVA